jgi:hypothetical protein
MMISVLVDARKPGCSGWTFTRGLPKIRVSGLAGGLLKLLFDEDGSTSTVKVFFDGELDLSESIRMVKVDLLKVTETSRVYVDIGR